MFDKLNRNLVEKALVKLSSSGNFKDTTYRIWFNRKFIPPKDTIRKAYEIGKIKIPDPNFTTDQAQRKLLKLGFPIVDYSSFNKDEFFTEQELVSFKELIKLDYYDKKNKIDQNIGSFLNEIVWEKTKTWANKLESHGWIIEGRKAWNVQRNNPIGQGFKKYTWFRVYPKESNNRLIYFTIGIGEKGEIEYKMDAHRIDSFFTKERINYFDKRRDELGAGWNTISLENLHKYSWEKLVEESHKFFEKHIESYFLLCEELWKDRRLMRLTWNTNNWETPTGHVWKKGNQKKKNIAYENQYGYGHEEWLFNTRYKLKGYQYGYIRGVSHLSPEDEFMDEVVLFTISNDNKKRYLIGKITGVEIIEGFDEELDKFAPLYNNYKDDMISELKAVKADYQHFKSDGLLPNIKFKLNNIEIFNEPIPADFLEGDKYNRYQPYKIDGELDSLLRNEIPEDIKLIFKSGKASAPTSYDKETKGKKSTVKRKHTGITDDLYDYYNKVKGFKSGQLSCEMTKVGNKIVDFVVNVEETLSLFEVKTHASGLLNIREALGQLFEYAYMDSSIKIDRLYIVGPASLKKQEKDYLKKLNKIFKVKLKYWAHQTGSEELKDRFIEQ